MSVSNSMSGVQRPMLSLRNDEISAVRSQLPTVYEALVQYDLLYLNAEARVEAKEQELQRCIDVGQEVLQQLNAVRQRCQELEEERDELEDERDDLDRNVLSMREQADHMKRILDQMHVGDHEKAAEVEVLTHALQSKEAECLRLSDAHRQLQEKMARETAAVESLRAELVALRSERSDSDRTSQQSRLDLERSQNELRAAQNEITQLRLSLQKVRSDLEESERARALDAHKAERAATEADIISCGSIVAAILETKNGPTTVSTLRESLHAVYQKFQDVKRRHTTSDDDRKQWEARNAELQQQFRDALEESQQSKRLTERMKEECRSLQQRLDAQLADRSAQDTERALKKQIDDREREVLDMNSQLAELRRALRNKDQTIAQLERQAAERQADARRAQEYADMESQLLESRQRSKMHEQTIALLQSEIKTLTGRLGLIPSLEEELRIAGDRTAKAEEERHTERSARLELESKLSSQQHSFEQLHATLVAVQEELMEAQAELEEAREEMRQQSNECAALRSSAVPDVRGALRSAEAENQRLVDELSGFQREVAKLQDSLQRVARDDAAAAAAISGKMKLQEQELTAVKEHAAELEDANASLQKSLHQLTAQDHQSRDQLEDLKKRMQEYLQTHIPELMFHELEAEFKKTRLELQAARQESLDSEEAASNAKRRAEELHRKVEKLQQQVQHTSDQISKLLVEPLQAGEKYVAETTSTARRNVLTSTSQYHHRGDGMSPLPRHALSNVSLLSDRANSSTGSPIRSRSAAVLDASHSSSQRTVSLQGADKVGFALLELFATLRHRSLQLIRSLSAHGIAANEQPLHHQSNEQSSDPSTSAELVLRALGDAVARAVHQSTEAKDAEAEERIAQCQREVASALGQRDATKAELSAVAAARQQLEAELADLRQQWQTASQSRHTATAELEKERQARRAMEAKAEEERRALTAQHSDVQFELQSMQSKIDQLKEQLAAERIEHQTTVSNLFAELTAAKQNLVQQQSGAHERQAQDQRKRQMLEQERDNALADAEAARCEAEDSAAHITRLTNLLKDSKDEIKHVTGLLASYENSDSASLQQAVDRSTALQQRVVQLEAELRDANRRSLDVSNSFAYKQQIEELNSQLMDDRRAVEALYARIAMLDEENRTLRSAQAADQQELDALSRANDLLEARLRDVEADRDPLRRKLHEILDVR